MSGGEEAERTRLEQEVEERLAASGWGDRAAAIAIDPELEIWAWNDSSVQRCIDPAFVKLRQALSGWFPG